MWSFSELFAKMIVDFANVQETFHVVSKRVSLRFIVAGCEMFGFPHVESDVTQQKDVRHVGGHVLLLPLPSVRNHRTARQNQRVRQNYF